MTSHRDSVLTLASLLRSKADIRPLVLLGAGTSYSSGIPLAAEGVRRIAKRVFADKEKGGAVIPEQVKLTEWQTWLKSKEWFISDEDRLAENFPLVVEHLLVPREYRRVVLLDLLQPVGGIGAGYRRLADFVMRGLVRTLLTTNFDTCLPFALNERRPHIRHVAEVNRGADDFSEFNVFNRAQIVWLHGKAEQYTDRNALGEVERLDQELVKLLVPVISSSPLIVIGYRGSEASIMDHLLGKNAKAAHNFKNGVYWCAYGGEPLHPRVEAFGKRIGTNFRLLPIDGFDELMQELEIELAGEDTYATAGASLGATHSVSFDDAPTEGATFDVLDHSLLLAVMREYCAKLGRAPVTAETLKSLLREQGLVVATPQGADVPTNGCILLFARDAQRWFSHAVVSASIAGKKRQLFSGNLIRQWHQLVEWLEQTDVNPELRVKQRVVHEDRPAYEQRALVELVVNMLVHRDYQLCEPSSIDASPGKSVTFLNPGALPEAAATRVTFEDDGRFRPVPKASVLRNRALCDVFFGIRAMEREGTGLVDVESMMRERGGEAEFCSDQRARTFTARLLQPLASAGSASVARSRRPTGVYVVNVMGFASIPEHLTIVPLRTSLSQRPAGVSLEHAGTFIHTGGEIWSFVPRMVLEEILRPIADLKGARSEPRSSLETDPQNRNRISWLLRKHVERHLTQFASLGLILEEGRRKGRRAYFVGNDTGPRTLIYDTPRRRGVQRQVVKQRDTVKPWFENEGFGYDIARFSGAWGLRIKPFYMFTGKDAATPLPAFARTARATRRMKLDRNKNVEDDLTFWSRFLSRGEVTINIGQEHVSDLLVDGTFMTIEVVEEGLLPDEDSNRMPA
jgi:hypothetical protein